MGGIKDTIKVEKYLRNDLVIDKYFKVKMRVVVLGT